MVETKVIVKDEYINLIPPVSNERHSALTEKSALLKEHHLRRWSPSSNMHFFGNESNKSLLKANRIVNKGQKLSDSLRPKQYPNCNEPNKSDSRFCTKCRMVLMYDAYSETLEQQQKKNLKSKDYKCDADIALLEDQTRFMQQILNSIQSI